MCLWCEGLVFEQKAVVIWIDPVTVVSGKIINHVDFIFPGQRQKLYRHSNVYIMFSCCKQQQSRGEYHHFLFQRLRILILTGSKNKLWPFPCQLNKNENVYTIEIIERACLGKSQEVGDFCMAIWQQGRAGFHLFLLSSLSSLGCVTATHWPVNTPPPYCQNGRWLDDCG